MQTTKNNNLIEETIQHFSNTYLDKPNFISMAPGRVNIIGEHTDYNDGLAMPAAIDRYVCVAIRKNNHEIINATSTDFSDSFSIKLNEKSEDILWNKYVVGTVKEICDKYNIYSGFDILIHSNLDIGSGLSSSAALELSIANAILYLFNIKADDYDIINTCQKVEHEHINIKSGILDQSASQLSKDGCFLVLNFSNNTYRHIQNNSSNCVWVLVDSMVKRKLASSKYHERVEECSNAIKIIRERKGKKINFNTMSDKDLSVLEKIDSVAYNLAKHVVEENERVKRMEGAISKNDLNEIGKILIHSHESLRDLYEVSCLEIDYLIDISSKFKSWLGGRIMGGGFGGNTINLIREGDEMKYSKYIKKKYLDKFQIIPKIRIVNFTDGAKVINNI